MNPFDELGELTGDGCDPSVPTPTPLSLTGENPLGRRQREKDNTYKFDAMYPPARGKQLIVYA